MNNASKHILLIEDNPGDADLIRLRPVEAHSDVAVSCVSRLSAGLASMIAETPAMVLLDLNLPDSHGADTYRAVLQKAPGVPVVVLSGQDDEDLAASAVHQGVQDYLVKGSFDSKQLARAMRYAIERQALVTSLDMSRRQQLQFKNDFLSHVSHELRTPLTCIHQFVSLMLDGLAGDLNHEQREHLDTVFRSVNQLRAMITDLLEATRAESGKITLELQSVAIADVARQAIAMLLSTAQAKNVGLEVALDIRIPFVYADPNRILQVFINLIENGIKFTPPDGSVMVKARLMEADADYIYISVSDTGRGIDPEAKNMIFERLYQDPNAIDDSRKGLGLGLFISKELVHLHGGRLWVESQLSHGSTFTFTLPVFSLAKFLFPVITDQGRLRDYISVITLDLAPRFTPFSGNWQDLRRLCMEVLQPCILRDKDVILPALGTTDPNESLFIVVSTDEHGAKVVANRILEQLERSEQLKCLVFKASSAGLKLPTHESMGPPDKLVQEVADSLTEMRTATLQRRSSAN